MLPTSNSRSLLKSRGARVKNPPSRKSKIKSYLLQFRTVSKSLQNKIRGGSNTSTLT